MPHIQELPSSVLFRPIDAKSAKSGAIATGASEELIEAPDKEEFFNYLEIYNFSGAGIELRFDNQETGAKVKRITAATLGVLDVQEGLRFRSVTIVNIDATTAIAADEVLIVAQNKQQVQQQTNL